MIFTLMAHCIVLNSHQFKNETNIEKLKTVVQVEGTFSGHFW